MSNYVKATNFTAKDTLPTGNAGKIIKGSEIDTEFTAIASAVSSKADSNSPALTGTPTTTTAAAGTNTTQIASTAFVLTERTTEATLTNKTITSPIINEIIHEGTVDAFETTLAFTDPTADRTITFPNKSGTLAMTDEIAVASTLSSSSGSYAIAGSTSLIVTANSHGRSVGQTVYLNFTSGTAADGYFTITAADTNTFTVTYGSVITTSGNVTGYYSNVGTIAIASADEAVSGISTNRAATPAGVQAALTAKLNLTGSAPVYGVRAWATFTGTTTTTVDADQTLLASGNIASVKYVSTGVNKVTFTTAMPDANYAIVGTASRDASYAFVYVKQDLGKTAEYFYIGTGNAGDSTLNVQHVMFTVVR
jgi:hypothetical protein